MTAMVASPHKNPIPKLRINFKNINLERIMHSPMRVLHYSSPYYNRFIRVLQEYFAVTGGAVERVWRYKMGA